MSLRALLLSSILMCTATVANAQCSAEPRIPITRYVINGGQVTDKETNLTWQRCAVGQKYQEGAGCVGTPEEISWAKAKKMDGAWRLPTKDEMESLISRACLKGVNTEVFPGINLAHPIFWTATETDPTLTWTVNLNSGHQFNALQSSSNAVLLVQGKQVAAIK